MAQTLKKRDSFNGNDPYTVPNTHKCKWVKEILGLSPVEMAMALKISSKTLDNWLSDENDEAASESVRFHRLLKLIEAADGVIRPESLDHWVHRPKKDLGDTIPVYLLGDENGFKKVLNILEDARFGTLD